jgi:hypothetical protein
MSTRAPGPDGPDEVHREQIGKLELARAWLFRELGGTIG